MADQKLAWFTQAWCRRVGIVSLSIAGLMAIASVPTQVLHDTVVHAVRLAGRELPEGVTFSIAGYVCIAYWLVWFGAILVAVYMAILDFRFIRLRFALESQALFRQSLGDELSARVLRKDANRQSTQTEGKSKLN